MCRRIQWSWELNYQKILKGVSLLFEPLPWLSAKTIAGFDYFLNHQHCASVTVCPSAFLTGTEYFRTLWGQAVVNSLSEKTCGLSDMSEEEWLDRMDIHGHIAYNCMLYLGHQRIPYWRNLSYKNDLEITSYAKKYWAKHLAISLPPNHQFYGILEDFATEWTTLDLDAADAHLVVQWLKVSFGCGAFQSSKNLWFLQDHLYDFMETGTVQKFYPNLLLQWKDIAAQSRVKHKNFVFPTPWLEARHQQQLDADVPRKSGGNLVSVPSPVTRKRGQKHQHHIIS
jgi:hypothetical protein